MKELPVSEVNSQANVVEITSNSMIYDVIIALNWRARWLNQLFLNEDEDSCNTENSFNAKNKIENKIKQEKIIWDTIRRNLADLSSLIERFL